jgi:hypothetical protein
MTMEKFQAFENWLRANGIKTFDQYIGYMHTIDKTLLVPNLEKITSKTILQKLRNDLAKNRAFNARSASDKSNILSGFKKYIEYVEAKFPPKA